MTNARRRARRPWVVPALLAAVGVAVIVFVIRGAGRDTDVPEAPAGARDAAAPPPPGDAPSAVVKPAAAVNPAAAAAVGAINQGDGESAAVESIRPPAPPPRGDASSPSQPPAAAPDDSRTEGAIASPSAAASAVVASPEPLSRAMALSQRDPLEARRQLTALVADARLSPAERAKAREAAAAINAAILFSGAIVPGDPHARSYVVQSGDSLDRIARSQGLDADWRLLKRINNMADERRLRPGQTLKLIPGAFHAIVDKSDFRMDLFVGDGAQRVFVTSLPVGLGEYNSTPTGRFKVRPRSKLIDPAWTNPRTGEHHRPDDPKNPIGEHWIGIQGIDESNATIEGYGIHGTIDPASIGHQASMGCVRLNAADIALVYELLTEPNSTVTIVE